ncbi:hypothetical protein Barb4_03272 [Bacteroidales bacterium Barb4]|nr:hypothetical protein Barb4_03272 [Bacteroidales bacterium Barb4]
MPLTGFQTLLGVQRFQPHMQRSGMWGSVNVVVPAGQSPETYDPVPRQMMEKRNCVLPVIVRVSPRAASAADNLPRAEKRSVRQCTNRKAGT